MRSEPSWWEDARRLKAQFPAISNAEIGRRLGRDRTAVSKALDPERARAWRRRDNAKPERKRAKRRWEKIHGRRKSKPNVTRGCRCPNPLRDDDTCATCGRLLPQEVMRPVVKPYLSPADTAKDGSW